MGSSIAPRPANLSLRLGSLSVFSYHGFFEVGFSPINKKALERIGSKEKQEKPEACIVNDRSRCLLA